MKNRSYSVRLADWRSEQTKLKAIRYEVFVREQRVPEDLEWDGMDPECQHAIAEDVDANAIGTGRLLPDGHIGRMAVLETWRGCGVGSAILLALMDVARDRDLSEVLLNAQTHALDFYSRFGFEPFGDEFLDADIPHRAMRLSLR